MGKQKKKKNVLPNGNKHQKTENSDMSRNFSLKPQAFFNHIYIYIYISTLTQKQEHADKSPTTIPYRELDSIFRTNIFYPPQETHFKFKKPILFFLFKELEKQFPH